MKWKSLTYLEEPAKLSQQNPLLGRAGVGVHSLEVSFGNFMDMKGTGWVYTF